MVAGLVFLYVVLWFWYDRFGADVDCVLHGVVCLVCDVLVCFDGWCGCDVFVGGCSSRVGLVLSDVLVCQRGLWVVGYDGDRVAHVRDGCADFFFWCAGDC